jgi:lysozyme
MRALAASIVGLFFAACSSTGLDLAAIAPTTISTSSASTIAGYAVAMSNPRFEDRKPISWAARAPWSYPVHGTDVSKYQREVDWHAARRSGISFAFIKATEGGDMVDEYFARNWRGTKEAGIPRSAYHFFYFCRPAIEQARWFIRHVPRDPDALPHVLDMEWNHLSPTCRHRPDAATVKREMRIFLDTIEKHYGKRPIIYTSIDFYRDNRLADFHGYEWWLRSVSAHPDERYDGRRFLFWQYTGTGRVPGMNGDADINVFNGSEADWRNWLGQTLLTSN